MMTEKPSKLIFVYNADSGLFNTMTDIAHKMLSPSTYSCSLCAITHGYFSENKEWAEYIDKLGMETEFLHRDEFSKSYGMEVASYPCIFKQCSTELEPLISAGQINRCQNIDELKQLLEQNLSCNEN